MRDTSPRTLLPTWYSLKTFPGHPSHSEEEDNVRAESSALEKVLGICVSVQRAAPWIKARVHQDYKLLTYLAGTIEGNEREIGGSEQSDQRVSKPGKRLDLAE